MGKLMLDCIVSPHFVLVSFMFPVDSDGGEFIRETDVDGAEYVDLREAKPLTPD